MDWLKDEIETPHTSLENEFSPWVVAIVDDDPQMHKVTELTLKGFVFEGRKLSIINAYSAEEAKTLFEQHNNIAMLLLDVVMEDDDSGLSMVKFIREQQNNHYTRIILRTGQPGTVPEEDIVKSYDIDGYKSKTELTRKSLYILLYTTLRSYRDVVTIQRYKKGLKSVIKAMTNISALQDIKEFSSTLMMQLANVLNAEHAEFLVQNSQAFTSTHIDTTPCHIITNDKETYWLDGSKNSVSNTEFISISKSALAKKQSISKPPFYAHFYSSPNNVESVFVLQNQFNLSELNQNLLELFSQTVVITLERLIKKDKKR